MRWFIFALAFTAAAHDIPRDIAVHLWMRPGAGHMQVLVRAPLKAMRDVDFPELPGGYLDVEKLAPSLPDAAAQWIGGFVEVYENEALLPRPRIAATRLSFESDRSFESFETALAHITGPKLANRDHVVWDQLWLDVLLEYPIRSEQSAFAIRPGLQGLAARVLTTIRFAPRGGEVHAYEFTGDPGAVRLDPRWYQASGGFVRLGFVHILDGTDHLLFLLCLVIPFRRLRSLIGVVTAFTAAHSVALLASAYNLAPDALWFPPLIETLIAASIVYMAVENIAGVVVPRRWIMAFGFGLVHGFGFSFALRESLQFAGSHLLVSLLSFNIGVELGQILVLLLFVPTLAFLFRFIVAERMGTVILSAFVAHTAWHWALDRAEVLRKYDVPAGIYCAIAVATLGAIVGTAGVFRKRSNARVHTGSLAAAG